MEAQATETTTRPQEGVSAGGPQFTNSFESSGTTAVEATRKNSKDYTGTDEWDAGKTPPSRFQQRKGSIMATPSSRDGHVERNRDATAGFHEAHGRRWSLSKPGPGSSRRKSSSGEKDSVKPQ